MQNALKLAASGAALMLLSLASFGCGTGPSASYRTAKGLGDRAYSSGRFDEAASAYASAHQAADRPRDAAEALYLEASSYQRSRNIDRARTTYERLIAEQPASNFARRAAFDLADLETEFGDPRKGYEQYRKLTVSHANDGLARRAMERYLEHLETTGGDPIAWLQSILPEIAATELDETARYTLAGYLEKSSDLAGARDAYLACAARHPYPKGALFDDALWRASLLEETLGRPEQAVLHLRSMLAVRETATMTGSYERPRFSPAQFRIAVLYRDALHDHAAARREFHRLYTEHPTSILRDDALWEEAKLARDDGNMADACTLAAALTRDFPSSRYAPCARAICPTAAASPQQCHAYVIRTSAEP
jgi:outer membrane protein assembly factor BamD (BamD/ComL family)